MGEGIVITGSGLVTALGTGTEAVFEALDAGESGLRDPADDDPRFARGVDPSPRGRTLFAGFVRDFKPADLIRSRQLRRMDWFSRLLLGATRLAADDAAVADILASRPQRVAIVAGSCFGAQRETAQYMDRVLDRGLTGGQPFLFPNLVLNAAAGWDAIEFDAQGINLTVSAHEASGEAALVAANDLLLDGRADIAIVTAADEFGDVLLDAFEDRHLLDPRVRGGANADGGGNGIVPGEAAAAIVLERASHARKRGAAAKAEVLAADTLGVAEGPHAFPGAERAAKRIDAWLENLSAERRPDALFGGTCGGRARTAIDELLGRTTGVRAVLRLRDTLGECPVHGLVAAALATESCARGRLPGTREDSPQDLSILVVGAGRGGQLAPVLVGTHRSN